MAPAICLTIKFISLVNNLTTAPVFGGSIDLKESKFCGILLNKIAGITTKTLPFIRGDVEA